MDTSATLPVASVRNVAPFAVYIVDGFSFPKRLPVVGDFVADRASAANFEAAAASSAADFYAVQKDVVDRLAAAGRARLWGTPRYGFWLDCFVGAGGLGFHEALGLLDKGKAFEFELTLPT